MRLLDACWTGDNSEVEQCLSGGADVHYEYGVSSDYYCTVVIDYGVHICICFNNNIILLLVNDDFYYTFSYYIV